MKYKVISFIVRELEPKKWAFGHGRTKPNIDLQQPQVVYFLEKYDDLSESVAFGQKLRYFTDHRGPMGDCVKINFEYFQIQKRMLQKNQIKNEVIQFSCSLPELWPLNCLRKYIFCTFVLTSARNLLKQFTQIYLKGLVLHFQKMILFIMLYDMTQCFRDIRI